MRHMAGLPGRTDESRIDREDTGWLHEALDKQQFEPARTQNYCMTGVPRTTSLLRSPLGWTLNSLAF